jgi:hypothetical protein
MMDWHDPMHKLREVPFGEKQGKSYKWVGGYECNLEVVV